MTVTLENVHKSTLKTRWGLYEFFLMPFAVINAPAQFMDMMNDFLGEYLHKFILVFLDDFLIYLPTHVTMLNISRKRWEAQRASATHKG